MPRTQGIELFVRDGVDEKDGFPSQIHRLDISKLSSIGRFASQAKLVWKTTEERSESVITLFETSIAYRSSRRIRSEVGGYDAGKVPRKLQQLLTSHIGKRR